MDLTEHFAEWEFRSGHRWVPRKRRKAVPVELHSNLIRLAEGLEILRSALKRPIIITCGYRNAAHNRRVGGVRDSFHLKAMAADLRCPPYAPSTVYNILTGLIVLGKMEEGGVGLYPGHVHYDFRGQKRRWEGKYNYVMDKRAGPEMGAL